MLKQLTRRQIIPLAVFLAVFILSGCSIKSEENNNQPVVSSNVQNKIDEQQAQIDELQKFKDEQQQKEEQAKREDCETRLKTEQKYLANSQRYLSEEQKALRIAEAGKCQDCYKQCMKSYGCEDENNYNCDADKKICRDKDASNLKNRRSDVAQDLAAVNEYTANIQAIRDECGGYLDSEEVLN
jgi:hypothetical protein